MVFVFYYGYETKSDFINLKYIELTFKRFHMIPKTTNSGILWETISNDFGEIAKRLKPNASEKWFVRRGYRDPTLLEEKKSINFLKEYQLLGVIFSNNSADYTINVSIYCT